jgi:hypothetical protein
MITIKKFNIIKKNCDSIIKKTQNHFLVANNSINIIKGHPYHIKLFEFSFFTYFKFFFIYLFKLVFHLLISINCIVKKKTVTPKKFETLLVSNLINIKDLKKNDYIFGNLEKTFKKQKINFYKVIINHTKYSNIYIEKLIKNKKNISIVNFKNNYFLFNFQIIFILIFLFSFYFIKGIISFNKYYLLIALEFLNPDTKNNLNLLKNFKEETRRFSYNKIILPYEGYSWERLILMSCFNKGIKKRICYNFSAISKYQHSLFRKLNKKFEPDIIFTVGNYSKKILTKKLKIPTYVLGSVRRFLKVKSNLKKSKKINFLIMPEGIIEECKKLFIFSIKFAKKNPSINFIWRLHPSLNFNSLLKKINIEKNSIPKNIILSKAHFFKDISISSYCIYRGSTSVITAIQNGVYPLYYNDGEQINIDPTFDLKIWKTEINNINDLDDFMSSQSKIVSKKVKDKNTAKNFADNYFQKMESKKLLNILKN